MAYIEVSDELKAQIEAAVAQGWAQSESDLIDLAVTGLLDEDSVELTEEGYAMVMEGIADMEAGRYITINTPEESRAFHEALLKRVLAGVDKNTQA